MGNANDLKCLFFGSRFSHCQKKGKRKLGFIVKNKVGLVIENMGIILAKDHGTKWF